MILGGRSKLVQNALYMVIVYFIFKRFLHHDIIVKVNKYGFLIFSVAILGVVAVTISRFNNMDSTNMNSIWEWIGLYAGEGSLNFEFQFMVCQRQVDRRIFNLPSIAFLD